MWQQIAANLKLPTGDPAAGMVWFALYDLLKGFASVKLYALIGCASARACAPR